MSATWLRYQQQLATRVEYHGPAIRFPIVPTYQQNPTWNRFALRRSA